MKNSYSTIVLILILFFYSCNQNDSSHLADQKIKTPQIFLKGIIEDGNDKSKEFSMAISPDCKTVLFTRRFDGEKQKIYETYYNNGEWTEPTIASFSTDRDENAHFHPDGKTVYFGSERPISGRPNKGNFDMNVWKTMLVDGKWSTPEVLPENINAVQIEGEEWPSSNLSHFVTNDGKTFYTGAFVRGTEGLDIYTTEFMNGNYSDLKKLSSAVNLEDKWEYAPIITADDNYLFTQVYNRKDGKGGDDIYVSKKDANREWLPSVNLGDLINSNMNECPLAVTKDGKYFFFSQDQKDDPKQYDGIPYIYIIEIEALKLDTLF